MLPGHTGERHELFLHEASQHATSSARQKSQSFTEHSHLHSHSAWWEPVMPAHLHRLVHSLALALTHSRDPVRCRDFIRRAATHLIVAMRLSCVQLDRREKRVAASRVDLQPAWPHAQHSRDDTLRARAAGLRLDAHTSRLIKCGLGADSFL